MSLTKRRYCVFGCADLGAHMHAFPHPERRPEMFEKWLSVVGNKLRENNPLRIYKNKRICDYHFTAEQKVASHRLMPAAVPCQHLNGIFNSDPLSIQLEHNYCIPYTAHDDSRLNDDATSSGISSAPTHNCEELYARLNPVDQATTSGLAAADKDKSSEHILKKLKTANKDRKKLQNNLRKMKKREMSYKTRISEAERALCDQQAFNKITKNMTVPGRIFTGMQFRHGKKKPRGRRYTMEEKILALSIYKKGPKVYGLLSSYFTLPSAKALKVLLNKIKLAPGINKLIFEKIKETVQELPVEDRLCTLIFDEMAVEPHIHYNTARDEFKGFVSHKDDIDIASHALVFMVKGIKSNYKQPVAYYFTQNMKTMELKSIIKDVIRHVHSTGLKILCTVCDQGATNVSAIKSLVAETKERFLKAGKEWRQEVFTVDGKEIIPLYDVPHLMKCLRNNLLTKDLKYIDHKDNNKEKIVQWKYFEMLYEADKARGELSYLHKLTEEHIYANKIKKMKVKMATQVFSKSVAVTADNLIYRKKLKDECQQIIPLVLLLDKLFDSLNAGTFHIPNGKIFRAGVKRGSPHHELWKEALKFFKSVKFISKKNVGNKIRIMETTVPTTKNFIKTIEGIEALWNILHNRYSLDCMLTRNFNQDPVENFFGNIRSLGVRNTKPDCLAFEGAFKTLLLNNYACKQSINANCEEDFSKCLQNYQFMVEENKNKSEQREEKTSFEISEEMLDVLSNVGSGDCDPSLNRYVCGWVLKKCLVNIVKSCDQCRNALISNESESQHNKYIQSKEYSKLKYWLIYPSNNISTYFNEVQEIATMFLKTNLQKKKSKENITHLVNSFTIFPSDCESHKDSLQKLFVETTVNLLINSWCKTVNRILSGKKSNEDEGDPIKKSAQIYYNKHSKHKM